MIRSILIKIVVLLPVILLTCFVTSAIMARYHQESPVSQRERPVPGAKLTLTSNAPAKPPEWVKKKRSANSASYHLTGHKVQVKGNFVQVDASVDIDSPFSDASHLWRLRAYREDDKVVLFDHPYAEQLFEMHPSGRMSPTFSKTIELPPGKYRVVVSLYGLPKGADLDELKDDAKARAARLIEVPNLVEIQ